MKTRMNMNKYLAYSALPLLAGIALTASFGFGEDSSSLVAKKSEFGAPKVNQEKSAGPKRGIAGQQTWGLRMTQASDAWKLTRGSRKIVVAVIDTGIDTEHPDLKDNLWVNEGEIPGNGIDDDGNGYIDDVNGWNFVYNNSNLSDNHGHGTHIAGIIGASGRAKLMGVAPDVSIMVLKYFDPKKPNQNPLEATIEAIHYAVEMGADVINYSGGGLNPNKFEKDALRLAEKKGILFVAAAGNERSNSDVRAYYPADYELSNILSVTAINPNSQVLNSSNYGERTVDLAAPGENILSTVPGGGYGELTGTSQATAFATGVAVLLMASRDEFRDPQTVIEHMMRTGEKESQLAGKTKSKAILNAYRALAIIGENVSATGIEAANSEEISNEAFVIRSDERRTAAQAQ